MSETKNDSEFDLSLIKEKSSEFISSLNKRLYLTINSIKKNALLLVALFLIGAVLGYLIDNFFKTYQNSVILTPNFGSVDVLYKNVEWINAKIKEQDTLYLMEIGVKNPKVMGQLKLKPIIDVFGFVANEESNFELIKLMAEDMSMDKIINDENTSKNFSSHLLSFETIEKIKEEELIKPLLDFFNNNEHFLKIQEQYLKNIDIKIVENDFIINQIDNMLNQFSKSSDSNKSQSLVFYNENTQLNDIIQTKNSLINESGKLKIDKVLLDKVVKESSININAENKKGIKEKMKLLLPIIFILMFFVVRFYKKWYSSFSE